MYELVAFDHVQGRLSIRIILHGILTKNKLIEVGKPHLTIVLTLHFLRGSRRCWLLNRASCLERVWRILDLELSVSDSSLRGDLFSSPSTRFFGLISSGWRCSWDPEQQYYDRYMIQSFISTNCRDNHATALGLISTISLVLFSSTTPFVNRVKRQSYRKAQRTK